MAYGYRTEFEQAQNNLDNVLTVVFPNLSDDDHTKLYDALIRLVDAKGDEVGRDTYDRVKERGEYSRDW